MKTLFLASALLFLPGVAAAQQPADQRWSPWMGCWELVLENARDAAARPSPARRPIPSAGSPSRPQICIEPSGSGVTLTTRVSAMLDAMQRALRPLGDRVDADRIGLVLAMTIRAVPLMVEIVRAVLEARRARGAEGSMRAIAVPVVVRALQTADGMGEALTARGVDD